MDKKLYIDANTFLIDSFRLARLIYERGYYPDFLIGLWRGGTPPGIAVHEFFRIKNIDPYHTAIKTQSYRGIGMRSSKIEIRGLGHVIDVINSEDKLLLVDDVFDTGHTIKAVIEEIKRRARKNTPEIKVATVYYKPKNNQTDILPDFYLKTTDYWIVFPHELEGLTEEEIKQKNQDIYNIIYKQV